MHKIHIQSFHVYRHTPCFFRVAKSPSKSTLRFIGALFCRLFMPSWPLCLCIGLVTQLLLPQALLLSPSAWLSLFPASLSHNRSLLDSVTVLWLNFQAALPKHGAEQSSLLRWWFWWPYLFLGRQFLRSLHTPSSVLCQLPQNSFTIVTQDPWKCHTVCKANKCSYYNFVKEKIKVKHNLGWVQNRKKEKGFWFIVCGMPSLWTMKYHEFLATKWTDLIHKVCEAVQHPPPPWLPQYRAQMTSPSLSNLPVM